MRSLPFFAQVIDLLVPPLCGGCGARGTPAWCARCEAAIRASRPQRRCPRCAGERTAGHGCWPADGPFVVTAAAATWHDPLATIITTAKLSGRREVFVAAGVLLAEAYDLTRALPDALVPVPTDRRRVRDRGLDHAWVLAQSAASRLGVPCVRALTPAGRLPDRGRLVGADRAAAGAGRLAVTPVGRRLAGKRVVVVDDVLTTGTTIALAAVTLQAAGVHELEALVFARAGRHRLVSP